MNIAFQLEVLTNSDGDREIVNIDCDPTAERANGALDAVQIDEGAWEFRFVLKDDFKDEEPIFKRFERYGLDPQAVHDACRQAMRLIAN